MTIMTVASAYPVRVDARLDPHLSRWLWLVKWWLLALPHLLIVGVFAGGGAWLAMRSDTQNYSWTAGGLIGLLVLIAAIILAVTGRYPRGCCWPPRSSRWPMLSSVPDRRTHTDVPQGTTARP
jgi:hypothetical protein